MHWEKWVKAGRRYKFLDLAYYETSINLTFFLKFYKFPMKILWQSSLLVRLSNWQQPFQRPTSPQVVSKKTSN